MLVISIFITTVAVGFIASFARERFSLWVYMAVAFLGTIVGAGLSFGDSALFLQYPFLNIWTVPVLFAALLVAAVVLADKGKMILAAAIILIAVIFIAGLIYFDRSPGDYTGFFQEELSRAGIERGGQPAEGFSAPIYLDVFPGFVKEDFNGVQSFEGIYNFNGTELIYTRTGDNPVTSAEDVISDEGYKTLLSNASKRLGVEVKSDADIATLLEILSKAGLDTDTEITDDDNDNGSTGILPFDSGAMGRVLIGPTCPVVRDPPDPNCADKGYMTSVKVIEKNTTKSSLFAGVETDKDGNYKVILPPGTYRLQADGGDPFPYCDWKEITITPDTSRHSLTPALRSGSVTGSVLWCSMSVLP